MGIWRRAYRWSLAGESLRLTRNMVLSGCVERLTVKTQIVTLIVTEILRSFWSGEQRVRSFRYGATSDPERARLLPGDGYEPEDTSEGARLLAAGEPDYPERTEPSSGRGADQSDRNPWQGE